MTENETGPVAHAGINDALFAIMSEVSYIEKDATNSFHGYRYASEETIKKTLRAALVRHGVLFSLETSEPVVHALKELKKNEQALTSIVTLQCEYEFTHVASGEVKRGRFVGAGSGRDDKGFYAAVTGAIKYVLTSRFLIPTGDDPENDRNEVKAASGGSQSRGAVAPQPSQGGQGRPSPAPNPPQNQNRSQGKGGSGKGNKGECPSCHAFAVVKGKPEFGGGWVCWKREGGCGAKYTDSIWEMVGIDATPAAHFAQKPVAAKHEAPADLDSLNDDMPF